MDTEAGRTLKARNLQSYANDDLSHLSVQFGKPLPKWITKPYTCSQCGLSFDRPSKLDVHFRIHTGAKPYSCEFCGKSFNQKPNLRTHMRSVHRDKLFS